ncbi:MAG: dynamin family protein [Oscillatoriales cyanobacterium]|nr:MAG: dynamin family protein [Oscillatoriales cyanobacterium]
MTQMPPQCNNLQEQVDSLLQLLRQESSLRQQDITAVQASLKKAISPEFEIVFAGAFSAGKSMLINALLERELLYSAEGHATGTECYIAYAESADKERVVLTFLSEVEIKSQAYALCTQLNLTTEIDVNQTDVATNLSKGCQTIIQLEGGENKSERAKKAKALILLLEGFAANRERIQTVANATYSMAQFNFSNLKEAASYARRGSNSAVLKRVEYYCCHPLLQDGNIIIDTPGIDAPVKQDAELTYDKIESETELMEKTRSNPGIRDRLFYIFNRIDETWYNAQLIQRLENLINSDFRDTARVYKTSGLLGFYGSLIKGTTGRDRFGLDSIFVESRDRVDASDGAIANSEKTPQFVSEFNRYCANSGKLSPSKFRISVNSYETPSQNYVRILAEQGQPLIQQLIQDSGIEDFRTGITDYLTKEKRPQLFRNLADDLEDLCIQLRKQYQTIQRNLDSQPREIEAMKAQELLRLNQELQQVGQEFREHIATEINEMIMNKCDIFDTDFRQLQSRMIRRLDELLDGFSVEAAYGRTLMTHPRNATAPLIAVLVEALYYLANQLEDILVEATKSLVENYFQYLKDSVRKSEYYRLLYRLLGNDGGIEQQLQELSQQVSRALVNAAGVECDRYVRESPRFYDEGTFSIYQFRETLQQTSQGFDCENMVDAQPAIRQLLRLDFEPKVSKTIRQTFRQTVNQTLKEHLLPMAEQQADDILQKYSQARDYLEQTLAQEAEDKIAKNLRLQAENEEKIQEYDRAVSPVIGDNNSVVVDCE